VVEELRSEIIFANSTGYIGIMHKRYFHINKKFLFLVSVMISEPMLSLYYCKEYSLDFHIIIVTSICMSAKQLIRVTACSDLILSVTELNLWLYCLV
jgi:hypothetical protein